METLSLIVAMAENRCIGKDNALPWHLPEDLKFFKRSTLGRPVIMGRKTFDSIGKPLPGRKSIVITRDGNWQHEGVEVVSSLEAAIEVADRHCEAMRVDEAVIMGGEQIYRLALAHVNKMYITQVHAQIEGDAYFPEFNHDDWQMLNSDKYFSDERNPYDYTFQSWVKK